MTLGELSDAAERDLWEDILSTAPEAAFREFVLEQVPLRADEAVISVGCGPGFETDALAEHVGPAGRITAIDVNSPVVEAAQERSGGLPQVSFAQGDIRTLPVADGAFEVAVAKQVLSEIEEVEAALGELYRVLAPGGRLAVTAGDRRTHVKHTPSELLARADEVYRSAMSERQLGTRLAGLLPEAGFEVETVVPRAKLQTELTDQVERGIVVQRQFLEASDGFDATTVEAWERELRELAAADRFLSCGVAFLYIAEKPETE